MTRSSTRLVSAKMPLTSSVSLSVKPMPCIEPRAELNYTERQMLIIDENMDGNTDEKYRWKMCVEMTCMKSLSLPMEMGLYTRVRSAVLSVALTLT